jgi:MtN3 and saliva related transmembrane protein
VTIPLRLQENDTACMKKIVIYLETMVLRLTIATIAPIITSIQLFPQLYKTYNTKSVDDLSLYTLILIMINNLLWLIHGYFIFDYSLIMSGIFGLIVNTILLFFYNIYSGYSM